ncbi:DUF2599 domain-containing protein [Gordonia iterans]|uniref:DUF2599 domain-containing protein n=1 Tax=Gordonia iterans TaxID=1004901 RepID=UPI001F48CC2B|nr:DUF2599 domain-containing protein [Gordonia iterans]
MRGTTAIAGLLAVAVALAGCGGGPSDTGAAPDSVAVSAPSSRSSESARQSSDSARQSSGVETPVSLPPPYIERAEWAQTQVGPSLQIYPTRAGRRVSGHGAAEAAWREVLTLRPDADTPGMRAQFDCHWRFARIVDPEKTSWNLEPGRPVVSEEEMIASRCNPGFAEE